MYSDKDHSCNNVCVSSSISVSSSTLKDNTTQPRTDKTACKLILLLNCKMRHLRCASAKSNAILVGRAGKGIVQPPATRAPPLNPFLLVATTMRIIKKTILCNYHLHIVCVTFRLSPLQPLTLSSPSSINRTL